MKSYIKYLPFLLVTLALSGCIKDPDTQPVSSVDHVEVDLGAVVDMDEAVTQTRALTLAQESYIETIDVLVFEYDGSSAGQGKFLYSTHGIGIKSVGTNGKTFKAMLATKVKDGGTEVSLIGKSIFIHVIANARTVWNSASVSYGDSFESVTRQLKYAAASNWDATSGSTHYFPMDSDINSTRVTMSENVKGSDFGTIKLYRSLTTVDIGFNYGSGTIAKGFDNFKLKKVILCNVADRGYVSAQSSYQNRPAVRVPSDRALVEREYTLAVASKTGYFSEIYMPETDQVAVSSSECPYILLAGYYTETGDPENTTELSWYKLDLPTTTSSSVVHSIPLRRNWRYTFQINTINGRGYDTREEAVNGGSDLMVNVNMGPWTDSYLSSEIDGPYHFDVSQTGFDFPFQAVAASDTGNKLQLYTNYVGGWKVDSITYEDGVGDWLSIDVLEGAPFQTGTITIMTTMNVGQERIGYIKVSAGRWNYTIRVTQAKIQVG